MTFVANTRSSIRADLRRASRRLAREWPLITAAPASASQFPRDTARVLHLIDDAGMGGVTRVLNDHLPRLGGGLSHEISQVGTKWRIPGQLEADIVVVHFTLSWSKLPFLAAVRSSLPNGRLVIVEHSYTEGYERLRVPRRDRFRTMLRLGYSMADKVVAVSQAQAVWLSAAKLVPAGRLAVIPQACDTSGLATLPAVPAAPRPMRLAAYGRYVPQKGFDILIEAMRQVSPTIATLEIAGQGADMHALVHAARSLQHVTVGGPTKGPAGLLARTDVVVVPSRWEAFGLVASEARAAGRPVLAARVDGLVEQIDPAWGMLFQPEDADALADAIRSIAACDLHAMGEAGRRSVATALSTTLGQWCDLFAELRETTGRAAAI